MKQYIFKQLFKDPKCSCTQIKNSFVENFDNAKLFTIKGTLVEISWSSEFSWFSSIFIGLSNLVEDIFDF